MRGWECFATVYMCNKFCYSPKPKKTRDHQQSADLVSTVHNFKLVDVLDTDPYNIISVVVEEGTAEVLVVVSSKVTHLYWPFIQYFITVLPITTATFEKKWMLHLRIAPSVFLTNIVLSFLSLVVKGMNILVIKLFVIKLLLMGKIFIFSLVNLI